METGEIVALARAGITKFGDKAELYIRPMYWAEEGGYFSVPPLPESTRFCLCLHVTPMPEPQGFSVTQSAIPPPDH
jgi:branched-chain amino acid aminotransferase